MNIEIICIGKIKESFFREALNEYAKRLSKYCRLKITELPDEQTPDMAGDALMNKILSTEGNRILSKIQNDAYVIATAIEGKKLDSVEFSELINAWCPEMKLCLVWTYYNPEHILYACRKSHKPMGPKFWNIYK